MKCPKCSFDNPETQRFCGECGTQLPSTEEVSLSYTKTLEAPKEELTTGSTFAGRYQIIEELGKGGMGKVYKVLDKEINAKVALKLIKPEISAENKTIERFRNELKLTRDISHKNVCRMYDLNKEEGTYYLTMEYVSGEDLKSLIRRVRHLTIGTAVLIAKQICDGLAEAHRLGVVHRDLKPQNVMIDKEGNVRIMDFGIARSLKAKGITGTGVMIGTPEYMSPEQAEAKEVDKRSDIYSLGVILYEMVTGKVPFEGETPLSIAMKHKGEAPKDPKELNSQISDDLSSLILKCLAKDKEKRYQSAEEVHSELARIEKGIPSAERVIPKRKPITSKEITVSFRLKKPLITALVVIAAATVILILWRPWAPKDRAPILPEQRSIAVLPFEDLSPQKDQAYFCDGLADELINRLTNIESLRVPARTSAFYFKEQELEISEIGKRLNVDMVLEGSLRKAGNKIRITVNLVNIADGYPLWSEKYERDEEDIFLLQDEISMAIVDNLKIKLLGEESAKLTKRYTENLEAYNSYLQGLFFWNKRTDEALNKAVTFFEKAIDIDPKYSLAYVGLADTYNMLEGYSVLRPRDAYSKAKEAIAKALEIDEKLAEAHTSLGWIKFWYDWERSEAEREFRRAIDLNPEHANAHHWFGWCLATMGRLDEARKEFSRALELDPLSLIINSSLGWCLYASRFYNQAIEQLQKALVLDQSFPRAHFWLGQALVQKKMLEKGITEFKKAVEISGGNPQYLSALGCGYALAGRGAESVEILNELKELSRQRYVSPYNIAIVYAGLGEKNKAFEWLDKAYEERSGWLSLLNVEPIFDILRSDPRFKALVKKLGLE